MWSTKPRARRSHPRGLRHGGGGDVMPRGELHLLCPLKLHDRFHEHAVAQLLSDLFVKLFQVYALGLEVGKQRHQNVRIAVLPVVRSASEMKSARFRDMAAWTLGASVSGRTEDTRSPEAARVQAPTGLKKVFSFFWTWHELTRTRHHQQLTEPTACPPFCLLPRTSTTRK